MIQKLKKEFWKDTDKLIQLLEDYEFAHIKRHSNYISFGRDEDSSPKSIVIYTENNEGLFLKDYARDNRCDLISFIQRERNVSFREVVNHMYSVLGVSPHDFTASYLPFDGLFKRRKRKQKFESEPISENVLEGYEPIGNDMFLKDNIPLKVQRFFGIGFCKEQNSVTIPIRRTDGQLVGVKARVNELKNSGEFKYFYLHPCYISSVLFGYSENYQYLDHADTIYVFESEKSVMQAFGYGYRTSVSIGSSSLSETQAKLLRSLNPSKIVIMHDKGLDAKVVNNNCTTLSKHLNFTGCTIYIWESGKDMPDKASPTDLGKKRFEIAVSKELKEWKKS